MIEYQEYTKLNNYNKQDKILSKLAVRYPNRFSDSLPHIGKHISTINISLTARGAESKKSFFFIRLKF